MNACRLRFGLLGPTVVYDAGGAPRPVSSAKGRALLTALLLEPGRVVSVHTLKEALWGAFPPASAHASLQNHVTRLRRLQLYVRLHGATPGVPPLTAGQALAALLRDLGAEPRGVPEHPDAASALLRSLLAPTRTLLVLDDVANAAQVRHLLPAGAGCAVIVTSRSPLTALDGATRSPTWRGCASCRAGPARRSC
ncbi:AfsR/SARP family transcriptional regulator [Streptomyces ortus]|uniref:AfsR/SARP family transcriptional regulator n=1 Tax=Streptomyces TaxID=1883 RepID=UPI003556BC7B